MNVVLRPILVLAIVAVILANVANAQEEKKKKGRQGRGFNPTEAPFMLPRSITLSEEQKKKLDDLKKENEPKLQAAAKKAQLTDEQRTAERDARRKAREEGKRGREAQEAVDAATNLTAEQKEGRAELRKISGEIRQAIEGFLTDDQKAQLRERQKGGRKKKSDT